MDRGTSSTSSVVLDDGSIVEMIHREEAGETAFLIGRQGRVSEVQETSTGEGKRIVPFSPNNNLLTHGVIRFASDAQNFASEAVLYAEVRDFIHRYCDISDGFEEIAAYYVLFTWVYDVFNEVPYLRVRGDFGSGKSRFLLTVGSLCYKPIFASGASTVSPLFRILDAFRGTLVMDESDFRFSDERTEVVKILNNGNARGFPVLRSEVTPSKEYNPRAFHVFGPKIIASRGTFADRALESRCITEEMRGQPRSNIPLNLPAAFDAEARLLRNKLLMYRFLNRSIQRDLVQDDKTIIEPRIAQIFAPLIATIQDDAAKRRLNDLARLYSRQLEAERSMSLEAQLLEIIYELRKTNQIVTVKDITEEFSQQYGLEYRRPITPRWIGGLLRNRLSLVPIKSHGTFVIHAADEPKLERLLAKYRVVNGRANGSDDGNVAPRSDASA